MQEQMKRCQDCREYGTDVHAGLCPICRIQALPEPEESQ